MLYRTLYTVYTVIFRYIYIVRNPMFYLASHDPILYIVLYCTIVRALNVDTSYSVYRMLYALYVIIYIECKWYYRNNIVC